MAQTKITPFEGTTQGFTYDQNVFLFDPVTDDALKAMKLGSFANPKTYGQIFNGTTSYTGTDITETLVTDEKGNLIGSKSTSGTTSWTAEYASLSIDMLKEFMLAQDLTMGTTADGWLPADAKAIGWGDKLPVQYRPVGIANETGDRALIYPKVKIMGTVSFGTDYYYRIKLSYTVQNINLPNMKSENLIEAKLMFGDAPVAEA